MKEFYNDLSSDSDSNFDQKLDKLKGLFSKTKAIDQYLKTSSAP